MLVILGLLTGGILAGQDLIRSAELRSVTTELNEYQAVVNTFRNKYMALPGDMDNAHQFWGAAGGSGMIGDGCETATGTGTETCSGNGNGRVNAGNASEYNEQFTFWQHLANAGLINGNYTGKSGSDGGDDGIISENVPAASMSNAGWAVASPFYAPVSHGQYFNYDYPERWIFGSESEALLTGRPIMTAGEAWSIDTKIDDGLPAYGTVMTFEDAGCATTDDRETARYALNTSDVRCALLFLELL